MRIVWKWVQVNVGNFYYWFLIFWREKLKISTRRPSKIDHGKIHQIAVSPPYISRGGCVFAKKNNFFKPGKLGTSIFPLEMAWSSHLINVTTQKAEKKEKKNLTFFHYFSPLSWLQALILLWNHCVLTKKSFWIVQVDFLDLIFYLKSLSDHSGKIPVLVKNQGTFYLK